MFELPPDVGLLAIGAAAFFLYVLFWASVRDLPLWLRTVCRLLGAMVLLIGPLALLAFLIYGNDPDLATYDSAEKVDEVRAPGSSGSGSQPKKPRKEPKPPASANGGGTSAKEGSPADGARPEPPKPDREVATASDDRPTATGKGGPAGGEEVERGIEPGAPAPAAPATQPPPAPEQKDWDIVQVFYGTDRAVAANPKRLAFSSDRGRELKLGRADVTVPAAHKVPNIERPWTVSIPYWNITIYEEAEDPKKHFTIQKIEGLTKADFLASVRARLGASKNFKNHAFVFIHGYNTSFDNAVYRTAQLAYDLKFDGAPFVYSWPSGGNVASYTYDRDSAEQSQKFMRTYLELVVKESGAKSVSFIAHSMGNQPLLRILQDLKNATPPDVVVSQVILAAPDVDRNIFEDLALTIRGFPKGVTMYAAANDRALQASQKFWGTPRAGDVPTGGPLLVDGVDTIDITAAGTDGLSLNHSGYAENEGLLKDIRLLLQTGERPPEKRFPALKRMPAAGGEYWRYKKEP